MTSSGRRNVICFVNLYDLRVLVMCLCMSPTLTIFSIFLQPYNEGSKKERKRVKEMDAFKEREKK